MPRSANASIASASAASSRRSLSKVDVECFDRSVFAGYLRSESSGRSVGHARRDNACRESPRSEGGNPCPVFSFADKRLSRLPRWTSRVRIPSPALRICLAWGAVEGSLRSSGAVGASGPRGLIDGVARPGGSL